jgi:putative hemolysin
MQKHWVRSKALSLVSEKNNEESLPLNPIAPLKGALYHTTSFFAVQRLRRRFSAKVSFSFTKGKFEVKTAGSSLEFEQVLRLRYEVFHREFMNRRFAHGVDVDPFDEAADHLIIIDREANKLVGTYRLLCSKFTDAFYTSSEFHVASFLEEPGVKLEMSRACIHKGYRSGAVMHLLWRGLMQYVAQVDAAFLFGCASVKTMDPREGAALYRHLLSRGGVDTQRTIVPVPAYRIAGFADFVEKVTPEEQDAARAYLPPLLAAYLKAGARICGEPALDRAFRCLDFFTVLRVADLSGTHSRKYVVAPRLDAP